MTTLKLSAQADGFNIIKFDGEVFEYFSIVQPRRIHISYIQSVTIETDRRGHHALVVQDSGSKHNFVIDEAQLPRVNALMSEIQRAMANFRFD